MIKPTSFGQDGVPVYDLNEIVDEITADNIHPEVRTGAPVGREFPNEELQKEIQAKAERSGLRLQPEMQGVVRYWVLLDRAGCPVSIGTLETISKYWKE